MIGVAERGASFSLVSVSLIVAKAATFLGIALFLGVCLSPTLLHLASRLHTRSRCVQKSSRGAQDAVGLSAPIFFVLMGLRIDLRSFAGPGGLGLAGALIVAAMLGKQVCSLGVWGGTFSAVVVTVIATTLITPIALKLSLDRAARKALARD